MSVCGSLDRLNDSSALLELVQLAEWVIRLDRRHVGALYLRDDLLAAVELEGGVRVPRIPERSYPTDALEAFW